MNLRWPCSIFLTIFCLISFSLLAQDSSKKEKEDKEMDLAVYLEEYRILALDFKKNDLYNYYLDIFLRVVQEKKTFEKDLKVALRYFKQARNLKDSERLFIAKSIFYSPETKAQSKERIADFYDGFAGALKGFTTMMAKGIFTHLEKLELNEIKYVTEKSILEKTVRDLKNDDLLELYCRILITRGQFATCSDLITKIRDQVKPKTFRNLQIESFLYEGDIKIVKTLLDSEEADYKCKKDLKSAEDLMLRRYVAIFHRIAGEFQKSLDCLKDLEKNKKTVFFYYLDGMKAARLLDKSTTNYLFKKAAQYANRKASKYLNTLLDWEEVKNAYYQEKLSMNDLNEVMNTSRAQGFRPTLVAADNLKQNVSQNQKNDEIIKHPKLKYLELLDIYWLVTLKQIEIKRRMKKK